MKVERNCTKLHENAVGGDNKWMNPFSNAFEMSAKPQMTKQKNDDGRKVAWPFPRDISSWPRPPQIYP